MDLQLKGRKVFVTGSTRGIGLAIAERFVGEGASVAICARNAAQVAETAHALEPAMGAPAAIVRPRPTVSGPEKRKFTLSRSPALSICCFSIFSFHKCVSARYISSAFRIESTTLHGWGSYRSTVKSNPYRP